MVLVHELPDSQIVVDAFHGTNLAAAHAIRGTRQWCRSTGPSEWLGYGVYFFLDRTMALQWAQRHHNRKAAVLYTRVRLSRCFDPDEERAQCRELLKGARDELARCCGLSSTEVPVDIGDDRRLSCAVFNKLFEIARPHIQTVRAFCRESLRGAFGLVFDCEDHVQLNVIDESCIISDPELLTEEQLR